MTYDERNARVVNTLHPVVSEMANRLLRELENRKENILLTSGTRTIAEQNALYEQGRTKPGKIVTNARGGESLHQYGVAFDYVPINSKGREDFDDWQGFIRAGEIGKEMGLSWGGDWKPKFKDLPHLQYMGGYPLVDFQTGAAQHVLQAPVMPSDYSLGAFMYLSLPEQIKYIKKAIPRATGEVLKRLQRTYKRLIG